MIFDFLENVIEIDSAAKEDAYRLIENAVLKNDFSIDVILGSTVLTFGADNIFPSSLNAISGNSNGINNGSCM
jgi:hypothetical protein